MKFRDIGQVLKQILIRKKRKEEEEKKKIPYY